MMSQRDKNLTQLDVCAHDTKRQLAYVRWVTCILLFLCVLFVSSQETKVSAATRELIVDGKKTTYTGKDVVVYFNSSKVNMKKTPGIVVNGTSYISYKNVFADSGIKATSKYDSKTGKITIKKLDQQVEMKLGSNSAIVNGKKVTLATPPIKVKFVAQNVTKILVPTEFVTKSLGYEYSWSSNSTTVTAKIMPPLQLNYDGKNMTYTKTKGQVVVDGTKIEQDKMPSIVIDNMIYFRTKKIVTSNVIGAKYSYDKETKTCVVSKENTEVKFTIGSKTAYVNGKKETLSGAPKMVKDLATNTSYVYVPGSYIAKKLGYSYKWNSETKTSELSSPKPIIPDDEDHEDDDYEDEDYEEENTNQTPSKPNNGDNSSSSNQPTTPPTNQPTTDGKETVLATYQVANEYKDAYNEVADNKIQNLSSGTKQQASVMSFQKVQTTATDREVFEFKANSPISTVSSFKENNVIYVTLGQTSCITHTLAYKDGLVKKVESSFDDKSITTMLKVTLNDINLSYNLKYSEDKNSLLLTVYSNYLSKVEIGTNAYGDFIRFHGINQLKPIVSAEGTSMIVLMNYVTPSVGNITYNSNKLKACKQFDLSKANTNDTLISIEMKQGITYHTEESNNQYTIVFEDSTLIPEVPAEDVEEDYEEEEPVEDVEEIDSDLYFTLPKGVTSSKITTEDLYLDYKFKLKFSGNYIDYYKNNPVNFNKDKISKVEVSYVSNYTEIIVSTKKIYAFVYDVEDNLVTVTVDAPKNIYDKIVVLDAGHGGKDPGATNGKYYEKNINFAILKLSVDKYFNSNSSDIKVYMTRYDDTFITLADRAAFASKVGADMFISLHMNSSTSSSPTGTEVYYYSNNKATMSGMNSKTLATVLCNNLSKVMGTQNRGAKSNAYYVVKNNTVPAVLIELGFMSNSTDLSKITNSTYQLKAAKCIYDSVVQLFNQYPTNR